MRIISFGDIYIDYYIKDNNILGICGGKTNANIIANLSRYYKTAFIGCAGSDTKGKIAIDSLMKLGVDTSNISIINEETKTFFITDSYTSKICPYCGRKTSYSGTKIDSTFILKNIKDDDYVVIDNIDKKTLEVINNISNKIFLDMGYINSIEELSLKEIINNLNSKFEIINLNERVYNFLSNKFKLSKLDIYNLFNSKILIITKGEKGSDIIYENKIEENIIKNPLINVEPSGAGDAFFSEFIKAYIENNGIISKKNINKAYKEALINSRECLLGYGARSHLEPLYNIIGYEDCICNKIEYKRVE